MIKALIVLSVIAMIMLVVAIFELTVPFRTCSGLTGSTTPTWSQCISNQFEKNNDK